MRIVSPRVHGVLDYVLPSFFFVAPLWFDFTSPVAQVGSFAFGGGLLLLSLLTRYPLGVLPVVSFPVHGGIEFFSALVLIALPWLGRFEALLPARNFFLTTGAVLFGLWLTTDYKAAEQSRPEVWQRGAHGRA